MNISQLILFGYIAFINIITFCVWGWDKYQSAQGGRRVSEKQLLTLCWFGGRAGALIGMEIRRHKTRKESFLRRFWSLVFVWIVVVGIIIYRGK